LHADEREEHLKNFIADFLKDTWYRRTNLVNTSDNIDLAIYAGTSSSDPVAVMIETKTPVNRQEMMTRGKPNAKAFHEIVLYYLKQVIEENNYDIKHLLVTNTNEWFIFDGVWFEKHIRRNSKLAKAFKELRPGGHDNRYFMMMFSNRGLKALRMPSRVAGLICGTMRRSSTPRMPPKAGSSSICSSYSHPSIF